MQDSRRFVLSECYRLYIQITPLDLNRLFVIHATVRGINSYISGVASLL